MRKEFCRRSWLMGLALGLCGKPLGGIGGEKVPVAYSYNGVVMPKLPEWDGEKYPYAIIVHVPFFGNYRLYFVSTSPYWTGTAISIPAGNYRLYQTTDNVSEWTYWRDLGESETDGFLLKQEGYLPVWTNTDILAEDGSVYLAASEPVPVYE